MAVRLACEYDAEITTLAPRAYWKEKAAAGVKNGTRFLSMPVPRDADRHRRNRDHRLDIMDWPALIASIGVLLVCLKHVLRRVDDDEDDEAEQPADGRAKLEEWERTHRVKKSDPPT